MYYTSTVRPPVGADNRAYQGGPRERGRLRDRKRVVELVWKGLRGEQRQVIFVPLKWQGTGVNERTPWYDSQGEKRGPKFPTDWTNKPRVQGLRYQQEPLPGLGLQQADRLTAAMRCCFPRGNATSSHQWEHSVRETGSSSKSSLMSHWVVISRFSQTFLLVNMTHNSSSKWLSFDSHHYSLFVHSLDSSPLIYLLLNSCLLLKLLPLHVWEPHQWHKQERHSSLYGEVTRTKLHITHWYA